MPTFVIAKMFSPFVLLLLTWLVAAPCRRELERRMPDGPFKRLLLSRIR